MENMPNVFICDRGATRSCLCWLMLSALMLPPLAGCGNDGTVKVTGVVSYQGSPVTEGKIRFIPDRGRPASSNIQTDGSYELVSTKDARGIPPGDYAVTVKVAKITTGGGDYAAPTNEITTTWIVPKKYSEQETTPLTATVPEGGSIEIDFDIPAE